MKLQNSKELTCSYCLLLFFNIRDRFWKTKLNFVKIQRGALQMILTILSYRALKSMQYWRSLSILKTLTNKVRRATSSK